MILRFRDTDGDTRLVNVANARSILVRLPREDDAADDIREYVHVQWHTAVGGESTAVYALAAGEGLRLIRELTAGPVTWRGN